MNTEHPDPKKHFYISTVKSIVRFVSCLFLSQGELKFAALGLAIAELLGVVEELV